MTSSIDVVVVELAETRAIGCDGSLVSFDFLLLFGQGRLLCRAFCAASSAFCFSSSAEFCVACVLGFRQSSLNGLGLFEIVALEPDVSRNKLILAL